MRKGIFIIFVFLILQFVNSTSGQEIKRTVTACVPKDFPPLYSIDKYGNPVGFAIDVMDRIAELSGFEVNYIIRDSWTEVDEYLKKGLVDLIPDLGITEERKINFECSSPIEIFTISIFIQKQNRRVKGIENLSGFRVASVKYNVGESLLEGRSDIELHVFDTPIEALFALLSDEVDALVFSMKIPAKK
jgi:ABC-type amino acid transport substrate-binding protein